MSSKRKLEAMFEINFYESCEKHEDQVTKYFCWDCNDTTALCETCKDDHHSGHCVIKVYRSSRVMALRISDAKSMFKISEIQQHVNNSWTVIYLNKRSCDNSTPKKNAKNSMVCTSKGKCLSCGYDMTRHGYKFCSIQCQIMHEIVQEEADISNKRRRRRKGIPIRAPLF